MVIFGEAGVGASSIRARLERRGAIEGASLQAPSRAAVGGYELGIVEVPTPASLPLCSCSKVRLAIWVMSGNASRRAHALAHMNEPACVYAWVVDATSAASFDTFDSWSSPSFNRRPILVVNKCDASADELLPDLTDRIERAAAASLAIHTISVSAKTGSGLKDLRDLMLRLAVAKGPGEDLTRSSPVFPSSLLSSAIVAGPAFEGTANAGLFRTVAPTTDAQNSLDDALSATFDAFSELTNWTAASEVAAKLAFTGARRLGRVTLRAPVTDERIGRLVTAANLAAAVLREWAPACCFANEAAPRMTPAEISCAAASLEIAIVLRFLRGCDEILLPDLSGLVDVLPRLIAHALRRGRPALVLLESSRLAVFAWMRSHWLAAGDVWKNSSWERIHGTGGDTIVEELLAILSQCRGWQNAPDVVDATEEA